MVKERGKRFPGFLRVKKSTTIFVEATLKKRYAIVLSKKKGKSVKTTRSYVAENLAVISTASSNLHTSCHSSLSSPKNGRRQECIDLKTQ
jgi:hypothetical protein